MTHPVTAVFTHPFTDHSDTSLNGKLNIAVTQEMHELSSLQSLIKRVVPVAHAYNGEDVHMALGYAIERFVKAAARAEMLRILATEDFFVAMAHSASKSV